jgi:hypothetical protein
MHSCTLFTHNMHMFRGSLFITFLCCQMSLVSFILRDVHCLSRYRIFMLCVLWIFQGQLEDHGPFKSLSKLLEHSAHLAVFMNYVISNSDPSSLVWNYAYLSFLNCCDLSFCFCLCICTLNTSNDNCFFYFSCFIW